ncbi:CinA family protein [Arthrobacter sp. ERGS1:01]|uniref:CinA family protein n=1 Tax=Arthrobacter sp. ERGS1:01 TaxID=1704044 RepID=UPI000A95E8A2
MTVPGMDLAALVADAVASGLSVSTAESLTGGMLAATIVDVPGASGMLFGGVVAYQNEVKVRALGVSAELLEERGAVDADVACAMALGACRLTGARVGLSTTGVAGPEPHQGKPVGQVYIGLPSTGRSKPTNITLAGTVP